MKSIRRYRREKGITQLKMAEMLGVSRVFLNQLENGKVKISTQTAKKLSDLTGTPWHLLVEQSERAIDQCSKKN